MMDFQPLPVFESDFDDLVELRIAAMRESLDAVGRFDPVRIRERLRAKFVPEETTKIVCDGRLVAFYAISEKEDHLYLGHLYVLPEAQGKGVGSRIMKEVIGLSVEKRLPVRLRVLSSSPAKELYLRYGFEVKSMDELDSYCERSSS